MRHQRSDDEFLDQRPYSRRWLMRGAAAFAVAGGIGGLGLTRWAAADDSSSSDDDDPYVDDSSDDTTPGSDDSYGDRSEDDNHGQHDNSDDDHEDDDTNDDHEDDDGVRAQQGGTPAPGETIVEIRDEQFQPASVTIDPGERVTWVNLDDDEHTATGTDFDTGKLNSGERSSVLFEKPGTYPYVCQFHSHMHGEVIVRGAAATPSASPAATPASNGEAAKVAIVDFAFDPQTLQISRGTTVIWTNTGNAPHTVTGDFLDSDALQPGDTVQVTFNDAGSFDYVCAFHPQMTGTIEVSG